MKKIKSEKEYEENHEKFKEMKDQDLYDYFLAISEIYEQISAEVAFRIFKNGEKNNESKN